MCLSWETLTSIIKTGLPTLVKLMVLVSYFIVFLEIFDFEIFDCDSQSSALLDLFISSDTSICSTMASAPLGNSNNVFFCISIDFLLNSQWGALFHCIAYDYSHADK